MNNSWFRLGASKNKSASPKPIRKLPKTVIESHEESKKNRNRFNCGNSNKCSSRKPDELKWNENCSPPNRDDLLRELDAVISRKLSKPTHSNANCPQLEKSRKLSLPHPPRIGIPSKCAYEVLLKDSIHPQRWDVGSKPVDELETWKIHKAYGKDHDTMILLMGEAQLCCNSDSDGEILKERSISSIS
jgi:hypothetical protein